MRISSRHRRAVAALLLAGMACASHAQFSGGGAAGGQRHRGGPGQGQAAGQPPQRTQTSWEQVSRKLYDLRVQLLITPEQGPAWEGFRGRFLDMATAGPPGPRVVDEQTAKAAFQQLLGDAQSAPTPWRRWTRPRRPCWPSSVPSSCRRPTRRCPRCWRSWAAAASAAISAAGPAPRPALTGRRALTII